ncbi:MAG: ribosome recycling factor [bacterium]
MRITFTQAEEKFSTALAHLQTELSGIRAGRASTGLVENIIIDAYGQKMPLKQLANIFVADPTLLIVQPWDKGNLETVKKTLEFAGLGINPTVDGGNIRLPIPALTEERRLEYIKLMKVKLEEERITIRQIRKEVIIGLEEEKKEGILTEDDYDRKVKELQHMVDNSNEQVEIIGKEKEADLLRV